MATDILSFLIFETSEQNRELLRRILTGFAIRTDVDVRMDWLTCREQLDYLPGLAGEANIALINADLGGDSLEAGRILLESNEGCLLVYYGARARDLKDYFPARPVAYMDYPAHLADWEALLRRLHERLCRNGSIFRWTSKNSRYFIPMGRILFIQSSAGALELHTADGAVYRMPGKLDEAEKRLPARDFLRIHKSTLVNRSQIRIMDRSEKSLLMADGSLVYISKAYYKAVSARLEEQGIG